LGELLAIACCLPSLTAIWSCLLGYRMLICSGSSS